jgi:DNA-binding MarR family transcriptional regulator
MSRGPGVLQRRVLETLAAYPRNERVQCAKLIEDLGCTRPELSRALKSLDHRGLVRRHQYGISTSSYCKSVKLTSYGRFKCQQWENPQICRNFRSWHLRQIGSVPPMPGAQPT